jgi:hypothetical protein
MMSFRSFVACSCLLILAMFPASVQAYTDFDLDNRPLAQVETSGMTSDVEVFADRFAAVVESTDGGATTFLEIWDLADPEAPQLAATFPGYEGIIDIIGDGGLLVVEDADDGLVLIRADTGTPAVVGTLPTATSLILGSAAGTVYALDRNDGGSALHRLDAADPAAPSLAVVHEFELDPAEDGFDHLSRRGDRLMAWRMHRIAPQPNLIVFDVADPAAPAVLWAPNLFQPETYTAMVEGVFWRDRVWVFHVRGSYGSTSESIYADVYDFADPAQPSLQADDLFLRSITYPHHATAAREMGDWICVDAGDGEPIWVGLDGDLPLRRERLPWSGRTFDHAGATVVQCEDASFHTCRIDDPTRLPVNGDLEPGHEVGPLCARIGERVYSIERRLFDISDYGYWAKTYFLEADLGTLEGAKIGGGDYEYNRYWTWTSVAVVGDRIFFTDTDGRFAVMDPAAKSTSSFPDYTVFPLVSDLTGLGLRSDRIVRHGDHLLIATLSTACSGEWVVWDVSDAAAPAQIATLDMPSAHAVDIHGDVLSFLSPDGLHVYDVADPLAPVELAHAPQIEGRQLVSTASTLYGLDGEDLFTVDVSNPSLPTEIGRLTIPGARHLAVGDRAAYVPNDWGTNVVDIRDPGSPTLKGIDTGYVSSSVHCVDDKLLALGYWDVLSRIWTADRDILDDTATPVFLSRFIAEPAGSGARISWSAPGARAADFRLIARSPGTADRVLAVDAIPGGAFIAMDPAAAPGADVTYALYRGGSAGWSLLAEFRLDLPELRTTLEAPVPNPFNPTTSLSFTLDRAQHAELAVYDAQGRRVRTLVCGPCAAGETRVVWDGCEGDGSAAASGVYFARLESEGEVLTRKMVLMK